MILKGEHLHIPAAIELCLEKDLISYGNSFLMVSFDSDKRLVLKHIPTEEVILSQEE